MSKPVSIKLDGLFKAFDISSVEEVTLGKFSKILVGVLSISCFICTVSILDYIYNIYCGEYKSLRSGAWLA